MEETRSSPPPPAAVGVSGRIRGDANAIVAKLGQSPRELGHSQWLAERNGTVRFGVRSDRSPSSGHLNPVKHEPYTDPYVRFCERAESRFSHPDSPYSILAIAFAAQSRVSFGGLGVLALVSRSRRKIEHGDPGTATPVFPEWRVHVSPSRGSIHKANVWFVISSKQGFRGLV